MRRILLSCLLCLVLGLPGLVMSEGEDDNKAEVSLYGRLWPKVDLYVLPVDGDASHGHHGRDIAARRGRKLQIERDAHRCCPWRKCGSTLTGMGTVGTPMKESIS